VSSVSTRGLVGLGLERLGVGRPRRRDVVGRVEAPPAPASLKASACARLVQGVGVSVDVLHLGVERRRLGGDELARTVSLELVGDPPGRPRARPRQLELRAREVRVVDDVET
jgi:hypothetical protein